MLHQAFVSLLSCALLASTPNRATAQASTGLARKISSKPDPQSLRTVEAGALALEEAVRGLDAHALERAVDWGVLLERAGERCPANDRTRKAFREEAWSAIRAFAEDVVETVRAGGSFRCVRVRASKDTFTATFRLVRDGESGFDRYDFTYDPKKPAGTPAADVESALEAEPYSQKLRRLFVLAAAESKDVAAKLRGNDALVARHATAIAGAQTAFQCGENRRALDLLASLPSELAGDPALLVVRLLAARSVSRDEFAAALALAREQAPGTSAFEMVALDDWLLSERHDDVIATLNVLDRFLGGDAWLDHLCANAWRAKGDMSKARELARRAIERESSLEDPYWTLLSIFVDEERHEDAVGIARKIEAAFDVDWREVERAPALGKLVASRAWTGWRSTVASHR